MKNKVWLNVLCVIILTLFISSSAVLSSTQSIKIIKDQEYFPLVDRAIKNAKSSIQVIAFEVGYYPEHPLSPSNILIQDLIAAQRRGVRVRVILEVSDWNQRVTKKNKYSGKILSKGGVKVRYDPPDITTHAKLIIIDSSVAILGSNNWTYYSLAKNKELAVLIHSPSIVREIKDYFENLWKESRP